MIKKIILPFLLIFIIYSISFAASSEATAINWADLLKKVFNFAVLVGIIWFFFGKKITTALRSKASDEHTSFVDLIKKKAKLTDELTAFKKEYSQLQENHLKNKENILKELEKEGNEYEKNAEKYIKKLELANKLLEEQEYQQMTDSFYRKLFDKSIEKLESEIKNNSILVNQSKYFKNFLEVIKKKL